MHRIGLCGERSFVQEERRTWVTFRGRLDGRASKLCCDMSMPLGDNDDDHECMISEIWLC